MAAPRPFGQNRPAMADDVLTDPDIAALARELGVAPAVVAAVTARLGARTAPTEAPSGTALPDADDPPQPARYQLGDPLLGGGMSVVHRAHDALLERDVVMKIVHDRARDGRRFLAEARIAAGLQHPGILPVYEGGILPDGRPWLTMREVDGHPLGDLIGDLPGAEDPPTALRRLLAVFVRVCEAVGFAHARGIVHRDLKPGNIMVGKFGEVIVLDWGIARGEGEPTDGGVAGTPDYMSPQHAAGAPADRGDDVYALGCVLDRILKPAPPGDAVSELRALADRCRADDPNDRPDGAEALAGTVTAWLDGARRRAEAMALVAQTGAIEGRIATLSARAEDAEDRAHAILGGLPPYAPVDEKAPGWAFEDEALDLRSKAAAARIDLEQRLRAALMRAPDLADARTRLAASFRERVLEAEATRDPRALVEAEARLIALDDEPSAGFLDGTGHLSLTTDPPGAAVWCAPYVRERRRRVPGPERLLGTTPLRGVPLPRGAHRLRIERPGCTTVIHAIHLERGEHWRNAPPGAPSDAIGAVPLPPADGMPSGVCYVPPGWCWCGGDPIATDAIPRRRVWVDGFFIERDPLTYATLVPALNAMLDAGRLDLAEAIAPPAADRASKDAPVSIERVDGRFRLELRHAASPDWPVNRIDWPGAVAWARWRAERSGLPWRLPHDIEREKAARGADGRLLPWGDFFDPTWANVLGSRPGAPQRRPVGEPPEDVSPYDVRGLAGNVRDWCANGYHRRGLPRGMQRLNPEAPIDGEDTAWRMLRGGGYAAKPETGRSAGRYVAPPDGRLSMGGVRLVCPYPWSRAQITES